MAQKNKCLNCLRLGLTRYQCRSKGRCLNCAQKHYTSICEPSEPNRHSSKRHEKQEDPRNSKNVISTMTTLASTTTHTNTLMQTARSTQKRIHRTSPRSEHTSRCHAIHIPFSSLQGKQHNSYENRLRRFSKDILEDIKPQRLPSYGA